jgi:hypothetical protein
MISDDFNVFFETQVDKIEYLCNKYSKLKRICLEYMLFFMNCHWGNNNIIFVKKSVEL